MPIVAVLRNRDSGQNIWAQTFGKEQREKVVDTVNRIREILNGQREAVATKNANKCKACRFKGSCDVRTG